MKKIALSILLAAFGVSGALAAPVTKQRAQETALTYIKSLTGRSYTARQVLTTPGSYYVVNLAPQGWVIVAADDVVTPIIGFNTTGHIDWADQNENLRYFLKKTGEGVQYMAKTTKVSSKAWNNPAILSRAGEDAIAPLIAAEWDQTYPYNQFCPPFDADIKSRVYNGCVAVAMGQAMSVQQWPNQPMGVSSYSHADYGIITVDYDQEPSYNWDNITAKPKGINCPDKGKEIARLLFHTGVSVRMGYGKDGSGIPSSDAQRIATALKTYFSYPQDIKTIWKSSGYTDATWAKLVYNELDAGRAVVYNAISRGSSGKDAGHSFNVDGYRDGMYHVNWGWGGNSNGYYDLTKMDPPGYNYNDYQVVITGIGSPNRLLRSIELSDMVIEENLPAGTVVGIITVNGETPKPEFKLSCSGTYDASFNKNREIPFEIKNGYLQTTKALKLSDYPGGNIDVMILAEAGAQDRLKATFSINVLAERTITKATNFSFNRANGEFELHSRHGAKFSIKTPSGVEAVKGTMSPLPIATFNLSQLEKGVNTLTISDNKGSHTLRIVK